MCGLLGAVGNLSLASNKFVSNAFISGTVRGHHSTGAFWSTNKGETWYYKAEGNGTEFLSHKPVADALKTATNLFIVGHNRWATRGGINTDNAHPFNHGGISLVHNGTLDTLVSGAPSSFGTDSEGVAWAVSRAKPEDVTDVLEDLEGAFALVWSDDRDGSLNFARNDERELYLGYTTNNLMVFASEKGMLEWLCERNKITLTSVELLPVGEVRKIYKTDMRGYTGKLKHTTYKFTPKERVNMWSGAYSGYGAQTKRRGWITSAEIERCSPTSTSFRVNLELMCSSDYTRKFTAVAYVKDAESALYIRDVADYVVGNNSSGTSILYNIELTPGSDVTPIYKSGKMETPEELVRQHIAASPGLSAHLIELQGTAIKETPKVKTTPPQTRGHLRLAYTRH